MLSTVMKKYLVSLTKKLSYLSPIEEKSNYVKYYSQPTKFYNWVPFKNNITIVMLLIF